MGSLPDEQILQSILKGDASRDQALREIFNDPEFRSVVNDVVTKGGGDSSLTDKIFEDSLILLDRTIRRYQKLNNSVRDFFSTAAKKFWTHQLRESELLRNEVIGRISSDLDLKNKIMANIIRNSGRREDGEDCYQNGVILLSEQMTDGRYRGGSVKGLLYQICFNIWRNELKRNSHASLENEHADPEQSTTPHTLLENQERKELLDAAFQKLGDSCQKLLQLKYMIINQLSMDEIAQRSGYKNAQNASNALAKCRKRLWELIGSQEGKEYLWKTNI